MLEARNSVVNRCEEIAEEGGEEFNALQWPRFLSCSRDEELSNGEFVVPELLDLGCVEYMEMVCKVLED